MAYPKIVYTTDDDMEHTLAFTYPPVQKPGEYGTGLIIDDYLDRQVERQDSITSSGVKQAIYERTDKFMSIQMDFIPQADLPNWVAFADFALAGGEFNFYPDADLSEHALFSLEDLSWQPKYSFRRTDKTTLKFRLVVEDEFGS